MPISSQIYIALSPYFANLDEKDQEIFYSLFEQSPDSIRGFLTSVLTAERISEIAQSHNLNVQQAQLLSQIVREAVLGQLFVQDMPQAIARNLVVDMDTAKRLSGEIIRQLFGGILNDFKKIQQQNFADRLGQSAAPMPSYNTDADSQTESPAQMEEQMASRPVQNRSVQNINENNIINLRDGQG